MKRVLPVLTCVGVCAWTCVWMLVLPARSGLAELAPEPNPNVVVLQEDYPRDWIFVHDTNFMNLIDGKVVVVDVASPNRNYKGAIGAAQFASFVQSTVRPEFYVAETFYARNTRGERTDVITIYDPASLKPTGEILLPGNKRGQVVTQKGTFRLIDDDRLGLVFNFTPAASVTVVDMVKRKVLNEIPIPGCSLIYPAGRLAFSSLCGNGTLATFTIDERGRLQDQVRSEPFFDIDDDPLFMKAAFIDGIAYFPSFKGKVQPVDLSTETPVILEPWSLLPEKKKGFARRLNPKNWGGKKDWRPGGWQVISGRPDGRIYVLMNPRSYDGSHKDGGAEVWVYDVKARTRIQRIKLKHWGVSIEVTRGDIPYLVVTNADMLLDVYDADSGELVRTIGGGVAETPLVLHAVQ